MQVCVCVCVCMCVCVSVFQTSSHEQDASLGQFLNGVLQVSIQISASPRLVAITRP